MSKVGRIVGRNRWLHLWMRFPVIYRPCNSALANSSRGDAANKIRMKLRASFFSAFPLSRDSFGFSTSTFDQLESILSFLYFFPSLFLFFLLIPLLHLQRDSARTNCDLRGRERFSWTPENSTHYRRTYFTAITTVYMHNKHSICMQMKLA